MRRGTKSLVALAIVVAEIGSLGLAATSASAQSATQTQRQIARRQQLILQQQRQIERNQRLLEAQNQQLAQQPVAVGPVQTFPKGLLGQYPLCPIGYKYSILFGCVND